MNDHRANDTPEIRPPDPGHLEPSGPADDASIARRVLGLAALFFLAISALIGVDALSDAAAGTPPAHLGIDLAVLVIALAGTGVLALRLLRTERRAGALHRDLVVARADATLYRAEAKEVLAGLAVAIDRQFSEWGLSPAEREIGLLLLKGLSLKEIAVARGTSERTARQQALGIYKKARVSGRAELSAFFLEDLLLPAQPSATRESHSR